MMSFKIKVGSWFRVGFVFVRIAERNGNWIKVSISAPRDMRIERLESVEALEALGLTE